MKRKLKDKIIMATCVLLLSIVSVMALEEFSSPEGTFMKIESQEELFNVVSGLNLSDNSSVYLMIPESSALLSQDNELRKSGGHNCELILRGGAKRINKKILRSVCCYCNCTDIGGPYFSDCGGTCPSLGCGSCTPEGCCE